MQVDILGSCVTRDAFSMIENEYRIKNYFARSSLMSIYSKKIKVDTTDIKLNSVFQRRMVFYDLSKRFRVNIKNTTSDYLIIDFIDERLKKVKVGDSIATCSREFINAKFDFKYIEVNKNHWKTIWTRKADVFITQLRAFGVEKVILHKAFWKYQYVNRDGKVCDFENQSKIKENNNILDYYYNYIEDNLKNEGLKVIGPIDSLADENHKWGLAQFHYEQKYYEKFMEVLNKLTRV